MLELFTFVHTSFHRLSSTLASIHTSLDTFFRLEAAPHSSRASSLTFIFTHRASINTEMARRLTTGGVHNTRPVVGGPVTHSEANPSPLLGMLDPPDSRGRQGNRVQALRDAAGGEVRHDNGLAVRALAHVPRHFHRVPDPWQLETLIRLEADFGYADINARMPPHHEVWGGTRRNAINMQLGRFRDRRGLRCWTRSSSATPQGLLSLLRRLTDEQIALNTTWTVTPQGIHPPEQPGVLYARTTFLEDPLAPHSPSQQVLNGLALLNVS